MPLQRKDGFTGEEKTPLKQRSKDAQRSLDLHLACWIEPKDVFCLSQRVLFPSF